MAQERSEAWTTKEFLGEVRPEHLSLHLELLEALDGSNGVEARFDGRGPTWASYNVYIPRLKQEVLRVRAGGERLHFQACIQHLRAEGQPNRAARYRARLATWVADDAGGFPWLSKTLGEINLGALAAIIREVARHPADRGGVGGTAEGGPTGSR